MWAITFGQIHQSAGSPSAVFAILQWLAPVFALAAVVVGVVHLRFARRKQKDAFLERLRQACAEVHAVKHPLWRISSEEFRTQWERRLPLSKLRPLMPRAEAWVSPDAIEVLHRFHELCEGPMPEGDDKVKGFRQEYKEVVQKLESAIGKFAGSELEKL